MINVLSGIGLFLFLTVCWALVRFGKWNDVMQDAEEEK